MRYAAGAAGIAGIALAWLAWPAAEPTAAPRVAPPPPPPVALTARTLLPDAERAGQVAGQLAELRWRVARAEASGPACRPDGLEAAANAFSAAHGAPDGADWAALGATLDGALADVAGCPDVAPVIARLRGWRATPPFHR